MKLSEFLLRYVYTRKCPCCSELIDYDHARDAFCPECRPRWDKAKVESCSICGRAVCECICMTRALKKSGALCHHKVVKYSVNSQVVHGTLMFIKKNKNPRVSAFLSSEIASVLRADEDISELLSDNVVVTYVPRSRSAVIKYGHDQSELLALCLAEELGAISLPLLCRSRKRGVAQKKLDAKAREKNSKNMYELVEKHRPFIEGKTVILVDDIVTTGSSMSACVSRLIKAGARFVICASVATTEVSKGH